MKHCFVFREKPTLSGKNSTPDGGIVGNGVLAAIAGNCDCGVRLYLSRTDLWELSPENPRGGGMHPLGYVDISVPQELYKNYYARQDIDRAVLSFCFADGDEKISIDVFTAESENSVLIKISGNTKPSLHVFDGENGTLGEFSEDGVCGIFRSFTENVAYPTHAYAAMTALDDVYYVTTATNHECENPREKVIGNIKGFSEDKYKKLSDEHTAFWQSFWQKSELYCSDPDIELCYRASLYYLNVCRGSGAFPPGLYGNFVTIENPSWRSDYHLNYNFQAPFYGACSANHTELTDSYASPLLDFLPLGREFARRIGCLGVLYPVAIGPKGICTEYDKSLKFCFERLFLGQKSNALHAADILVCRWRATHDSDFAREIAYPFVKECIEFFTDYAEYENGRYSIPRDAIHEVPVYRDDFTPEKYKKELNDKNNCLTLGLLRMSIPAAVEMATALGVDSDKVAKWNDFLKKLSPYPLTFGITGLRYRYTESGMRWNDTNDCGLQHIYPCGAVSVHGSKKDLHVARNTFRRKERIGWFDGNAVSSFYPMAAHIGIGGDRIFKKLLAWKNKRMLPNGLFFDGAGCLEYCGVFLTTVNEMCMQSFDGILRIFPCKTSADMSFKNLRADGAFLVSASLTGGVIGNVEIESEKGGILKIENPFSCPCRVIRQGIESVYDGKIFELSFEPGEKVTLCAK